MQALLLLHQRRPAKAFTKLPLHKLHERSFIIACGNQGKKRNTIV